MMESSTVGIALTMNESVAPTAPIDITFTTSNSRESSSPQTPPQTPPLDLTQSQSWPSMPLIHQGMHLPEPRNSYWPFPQPRSYSECVPPMLHQLSLDEHCKQIHLKSANDMSAFKDASAPVAQQNILLAPASSMPYARSPSFSTHRPLPRLESPRLTLISVGDPSMASLDEWGQLLLQLFNEPSVTASAFVLFQAQQLTNKSLCGDCLVRSSDDLHSHVHTEYDPQTPYHEADNNLNHEQKMGIQHHQSDQQQHSSISKSSHAGPVTTALPMTRNNVSARVASTTNDQYLDCCPYCSDHNISPTCHQIDSDPTISGWSYGHVQSLLHHNSGGRCVNGPCREHQHPDSASRTYTGPYNSHCCSTTAGMWEEARACGGGVWAIQLQHESSTLDNPSYPAALDHTDASFSENHPIAELTNAVKDQHHIFDSADHANHASDLQPNPMARMIGLVALFPIPSPNQRTTTEMIGRAHDELYLDVMILPAYRGHGYATESAKRVLMEHFAPSANAISTPLPFSSLSNTTDTILPILNLEDPLDHKDRFPQDNLNCLLPLPLLPTLHLTPRTPPPPPPPIPFCQPAKRIVVAAPSFSQHTGDGPKRSNSTGSNSSRVSPSTCWTPTSPDTIHINESTASLCPTLVTANEGSSGYLQEMPFTTTTVAATRVAVKLGMEPTHSRLVHPSIKHIRYECHAIEQQDFVDLWVQI
ncbi:hypothetical protein QVD99_003915 [Batrachochytrium dendrobatidis]|nr:hypothetical protein QVD99_003915 [Batrachochytrium dendrobatidis]